MSTNSPTSRGGSHGAGAFLVVGTLFAMFFVIAFMAQIQTTEAQVGWGGAVSIWHPSFEILLQPLRFFGIGGAMSDAEGAAAFVGWAVEVVYLGFIFIGVEVLMHAVTRSGKFLGKVFLVCAAGVLLYNGWNDWHYGTFGVGDGGHWAFAIVLSGVVAFFGSIALVCFEKGWKTA